MGVDKRIRHVMTFHVSTSRLERHTSSIWSVLYAKEDDDKNFMVPPSRYSLRLKLAFVAAKTGFPLRDMKYHVRSSNHHRHVSSWPASSINREASLFETVYSRLKSKSSITKGILPIASETHLVPDC